MEIFRRGGEVVLRERPRPLRTLLHDLSPWPDDIEIPALVPEPHEDL